MFQPWRHLKFKGSPLEPRLARQARHWLNLAGRNPESPGVGPRHLHPQVGHLVAKILFPFVHACLRSGGHVALRACFVTVSCWFYHHHFLLGSHPATISKQHAQPLYAWANRLTGIHWIVEMCYILWWKQSEHEGSRKGFSEIIRSFKISFLRGLAAFLLLGIVQIHTLFTPQWESMSL